VKRTLMFILVVSLICVLKAAGARCSGVRKRTGYSSEGAGRKLVSQIQILWTPLACFQNVTNLVVAVWCSRQVDFLATLTCREAKQSLEDLGLVEEVWGQSAGNEK
jgi:hypothetical protein